MNNAIILHGKPGKEEYYDSSVPSCSNHHWLPWLQKQLLARDIKADTPEVPFAFNPEWDLWLSEVERFDIKPSTMLVGHSCGGGFWVRYLSEHKKLKVGKVVLVAPSLGIGWDSGNFFDFEIDPDILNRAKSITIFYSDNDKEAINQSVAIFKEKLPGAVFKELKGCGHFTLKDMQSNEFPELLEECLHE